MYLCLPYDTCLLYVLQVRSNAIVLANFSSHGGAISYYNTQLTCDSSSNEPVDQQQLPCTVVNWSSGLAAAVGAPTLKQLVGMLANQTVPITGSVYIQLLDGYTAMDEVAWPTGQDGPLSMQAARQLVIMADPAAAAPRQAVLDLKHRPGLLQVGGNATAAGCVTSGAVQFWHLTLINLPYASVVRGVLDLMASSMHTYTCDR